MMNCSLSDAIAPQSKRQAILCYDVCDCRNVIDTASNYRDGRAQKAVGKAVHALRLSGKIDRKALFFSTKAGFVDQTILQKLKSRSKIHEGDILGGASCIHPVCLEDSLRTSLQDMQLETVTSDFGSIDFVFIPEKAPA